MTPAPLPALNFTLLLRALFKRAPRRDSLAAGLPEPTVYAVPRVDPRQLRRYNQMLGFEAAAFPLTFCYLLVQRAHLGTMLAPGFPFRVAGMIHVANALAEQRGCDPLRPFTIHTTPRVEQPGASGSVQVVLDSVGHQDGAIVFTCSSTYLAVLGQRKPRTGVRPDEAITQPRVAQWQLDAGSGRRYAAVSGDWNPIHLWRWTARLMGLRSPIIHGMHTVAKTCAELERQSQRRVTGLSARFRAPIPLARSVTLFADAAAGTFAVGCDGGRAVEGTFTLDAVGSKANLAA
jgi:hypothetical protein